MKIFFCLAFCLLGKFALCQNESDDIDTRIHLLTTIVRGQLRNRLFQGSGFFYADLDTSKKGGWRRLEKLWLITNRHLVFFKTREGQEELPEIFTFYFRKIENGNLKWLPIQYLKIN